MLGLSACHSPKSTDPAETFQQTRLDFLQGHLDVARDAASEERRKLLGENPEWSYRFCLLEAEILSYQGHSEDVISVLGEGSKSFVPRGDLVIKQEILLSLAYVRVGQEQRSNEEIEKAKQLSASTRSSLEGEVLRTEGLLHNHRGELKDSDNLYRDSLDVARKQGDSFLEATDLLNMGRVALQAEHIDEALERFNASVAIAKSIGAGVILATDLGNAGWASFQLGDFQNALADFQQAEAEDKSLGASNDEILCLQGAGLSFYRLNNLNQAQRLYEEALQMAQSTHDTPRIAETRASLGFLYLQLDQLDDAKTEADVALQAAKEVGDKSTEMDASLLRALLAVRRSDGPETESILTGVYKEVAQMPSLRWKIENSFADMYAGRREARQAETWFNKSIATFEAQRASVHDEEARLPFFANGDMLYRDYAEYLIASGRSNEALQLLDNVRARSLEEGLAPSRSIATAAAATSKSVALNNAPIHAQDVARQLDATILFYSLGPQKSCLWAIDRTSAHMFALPRETEITAYVKRYQASILKSSDPLRDRNADAQWLYSTLISPAETFIPKDSRVFVISNGSLNSFNMETLLKPGARGPHYWIEDVTITSASSIRLLARFAKNRREPEHETKNLLLIGDPVTRGTGYAPLANAASEIESIQKYFPVGTRTVLSGAAAIPAAYPANRPEQASYIHFVAHGTASSLLPLDSAILLSSPPGRPDDFKLYARDIVHPPIHARLVTISACFGSGLRNYEGEGLVGLSWAFLRAGAHHVIGALWEVNDASTPQLMNRLYSGLATGRGPNEALREAKLSLMHSESVYRKPLYWAAFQLYAGS